jgi:hypothetical protein
MVRHTQELMRHTEGLRLTVRLETDSARHTRLGTTMFQELERERIHSLRKKDEEIRVVEERK